MVEPSTSTQSGATWIGSLVLPISFLIGWKARSMLKPSNQKNSLLPFLTYRYKVVLIVSPEVKLLRARLAEHCAQASVIDKNFVLRFTLT